VRSSLFENSSLTASPELIEAVRYLFSSVVAENDKYAVLCIATGLKKCFSLGELRLAIMILGEPGNESDVAEAIECLNGSCSEEINAYLSRCDPKGDAWFAYFLVGKAAFVPLFKCMGPAETEVFEDPFEKEDGYLSGFDPENDDMGTFAVLGFPTFVVIKKRQD
jgi:hypothetical protein